MQKLVVANLKMNILTLSEREQYFIDFKKELKAVKMEDICIVLCPPAVHLEAFAKKLKSKNVSIGAQNIFWEEKGSYTGEVSATMIKNLGVEYSILGHSERRRYLGETNEQVNLKLKALLKNRLVPILCIGEGAAEKTAGTGEEMMLGQLEGCLKDLNPSQIEKIVICYEPVWAISSNNPVHPPTSDEILGAKLLMKKYISDKFGIETAQKVKMIYGGSVAADNVKQICLDPGMDGALVGRESLVPRDFLKIVKAMQNS